MKTGKPGILALRALNQYRRRDVISYLALRYYLNASATRPDRWANEVASELVRSRVAGSYYKAYHFKDISEDKIIEHRSIFLPSANEALAEAALLNECSKHPLEFGNPSCVFSYALSKAEDSSGVYPHYMLGLQARHHAMAEACDANPESIVHYTDIRKFYPFISSDLALEAWRTRCLKAKLDRRFQLLGEKLIDEHSGVEGSSHSGILTGPMFSHLLGNLVLRSVDEEFGQDRSIRYFRYVDDISLVGDEHRVNDALTRLGKRLRDKGFELHPASSPKCMRLTAGKWLEGRNDYAKSRRQVSWMTLIGDLKRFLGRRTNEREELKRVFSNVSLRIPVRDYAGAVQESDFVLSLLEWARHPWMKIHINRISIRSIVTQAKWLRESYEREFIELADKICSLDGYDRKRNIPKLRYRAGRLIYLATIERLSALSEIARGIPELYFHAVVMKAVATGVIDEVLSLGTNACQAAAQPIKAGGGLARLCKVSLSTVEEQGLAVFILNGVAVDSPRLLCANESELLQIARHGSNRGHMTSQDMFIRELACLHGISPNPRHAEMLNTAFDQDEELEFDAIVQLQQSIS